MPDFLDKLTNEKEFNLRTLCGKALSVLSIEIVIGLYAFICRKLDSEQVYSVELYNEKKNRLLLISNLRIRDNWGVIRSAIKTPLTC